MEVVAAVQEAQVAPAELADQQMADTLAQTEAARPAGPVGAVVAGDVAVVGETSSSAAAAADAEAAARQRVEIMNRANPRFVLRQHMAAKVSVRVRVGLAKP